MPKDQFNCTHTGCCDGVGCVYRDFNGIFQKCPNLKISNKVDDEKRG